ncbi:Seed linoleate 9S-lipoxygenase-3 [Vigna angularis]|uniref:Seed linoleate 9S-lipoxygenase-3 n=1 Tax=Phaseolus angularis TaxID=3914 RepID=A0A8T0JDE9_PHAAN|nr:Seed linoleate 9S-lipoxygenase-3 [Vigna angularis]
MFSGMSGLINKGHKIKGTVVLMRKNVLDVNSVTSVGGIVGQGLDLLGSTVDNLTAFLGRSVSLQLISATKPDANGKGKLGKATFLEGIITSLPTLGAGQSAFKIHFEWDDEMGIPGAFYIKNFMQTEFFLVSLTLEDVPNHGSLHFLCNSWIYNAKHFKNDRIFFVNQVNEFDSFDDVHGLYSGGIKLPTDLIRDISPFPVLKEFLRTDGEQVLKFPPPKVIQVSRSAWMTDEEFAREMLAGVNPNMIRLLQDFPPRSKLDSQVYNDHTSQITKEHLEPNLEGLTVDEAIQNKRLFILDHHDSIMPYLRRINATSNKAYATRTILFLKNDRTLRPLAIELSLPHPGDDKSGVVSQVVLPADEGVESSIWLLAKAYVIVNDSSYHQLVSHWLNTHAVMEPFVIATNRHLSVVHPIYKLLHPHYRDTMNINALARGSLVNDGGIIEKTFLWGRYSMEMSATIYKDWVFTDQALPADLIKRGIATEDPECPHGLRLFIEDYPYAVDGLEIWDAIKTWVHEYVSLYYKSDDTLKEDPELQAWWKELVEVGHGDKKNESWWPKMQTREELVEACSIVIWTASALHAAVNFGQYPYGGLILNRPTISRRFMPEKGSAEYEELKKSPQKALLRTITPKFQTLIDLSVIEILSRHASDEIYLGERDNPNWTSDTRALEAFKRFGKKLSEIEKKLSERNNDEKLRNRHGPVQMPYTLLFPSSDEGLTFRGIPNSISI